MNSGPVVQHIDAVDAYARTLFVRAQQSPSPAVASGVTQGIQKLHLALRHLRIQVADPDSLTNSAKDDGDGDDNGYLRRLKLIVEGSESAFKLLEHVLDRHGGIGAVAADGMSDGAAAVIAKLARERDAIEAFLDRVQLGKGSSFHAHLGARQEVDKENQPDLEDIKDKLDMVAERLFTHRDGDPNRLTNSDDDLWQDLKAELEKEGFSPQVLKQHKDVLRAYMRELQSVFANNGGAPPTVQGLLDYETRASTVRSKGHGNEEKLAKSKGARPAPEEIPIGPLQKQFSYDRNSMSSEEFTNEISDSLRVISTMDLVEMDSPINDMADPHQQHPSRSRGASMSSPQSAASPRYLHPGRDFELSRSSGSHPVAPRSFSQSQPSLRGQAAHDTSARSSHSGRPSLRLAPDNRGRDIPMDAQWTKIKRSLVSPEVLQHAGLRFEARPDYVAVLGRLDRDQISYYARLSAECRAARVGKPPPAHHHENKYRRHNRRGSSRHGHSESDSYSSDSSEEEEDARSDGGIKNYPVIVDPPAKQTASPTSTVLPKPILKNKNSNHFRSNSEPHSISASSHTERDDHDRRHHRRHDRDGRYKDDYSQRRDDDRRRRDDDGYSRGDRHRDRDEDDDYNRYHDSGRHRRSYRRSKRRGWSERLGAVGIGGAAVSLLGILAEAAAGN